MATSRLILVTGATGQQGGAAAAALLRRGQRVRALTRKPEHAQALAKRGAEVVKGDLTDKNSLTAALKGVDGVFAMTTSMEGGVEAEVRQGKTLVDAAKAAGVKHTVYTSVASATKKTGIPHFESKAEIERHLKQSGLPCTILRPVFFMENFGTMYLPGLRQGQLAAPLKPQTKLQMISVRDIGEFAAAAFVQPDGYLNREIELAADTLTFPQAAEAISAALGKPVVFKEIPESQAAKTLGADFARMFKWFNDVGYDVDIEALQSAYGMRMTGFKEALAAAEWANPAKVAA